TRPGAARIEETPLLAGNTEAAAPPRTQAVTSLPAAILMGVIGPEVFIVQPGFVQGLVAYLGFSEPQAGYTASAEMFGIAATTILLTFVAHRIDWRRVFAVALLVMFAANALSTFTDGFVAFTTLRFIAGLGAGALISLSFAAIGLTDDP